MLCCWNIGDKSRIIPLCGYFTSPFNLLSVVIAACVSGPHVDYPFWKQCYKSVLSEKKMSYLFLFCVYVFAYMCACVSHVYLVSVKDLRRWWIIWNLGLQIVLSHHAGAGTEPGSRAKATTVPLLKLQALLSWTPALAPREIFYKSVSGWLRDVVSLIIRRLIGPEQNKACLDASFWFTHP